MLDFVQHVVVIGCGGIGSWLLSPLLRLLSARKFTGEIHFWDGDRYGLENQGRQEFGSRGLGRNKAEAQGETFRLQYPALPILAHGEYVTEENALLAVPEGALVFVAVDNHPARALAARTAGTLRDVCVITAGNEKLDGNVHLLLRRAGRDLTSPLLERHPEIGAIRDGDRALLGCEARIERGETQLLVTNLMAASACLVLFQSLETRPAGRTRKALAQELFFDVGQGALQLVPVAAGG
jgi:hypothetical protein